MIWIIIELLRTALFNWALLFAIGLVYALTKIAHFLDEPWVNEKSKKYRIYKIHGSHYRTWDYILQKKGFIFWHRCYDQHRAEKDGELYKGWIETYNLA